VAYGGKQRIATAADVGPSVVRQGATERRRRALIALLADDPLATDATLAERFGVSVQTVRLDRLALGIPELRRRTTQVAERALGRVRALAARELVGELIDLRLGEEGLSRLRTEAAMAFSRSGVIRGQFLYAQAESLALALIDADEVLTGLARIKFRRPVAVGEVLLARGRVLRPRAYQKYVVEVVTRVDKDEVFRGKFLVAVVGGETA
jgi:acyl-coenzyme A thioesterase PaaI-like protein